MRPTILCLLLTLAGTAAEPAADDSQTAHEALRSLRTELSAALNAGEVDRLVPHLAPESLVTFVDQTHIDRPDELVPALAAMKQRYELVDWRIEPTADHETRFIAPGVGIVAGGSVESYRLEGGDTIQLDTRWTATVIERDGGWQLASLHVGLDPGDNPILEEVTAGALRLAAIVGGVALVLGLVIGLALGRRRRTA